ncbi:MAG: noncanonical pyrimidine nucleotidase, YjjG family [Chryseobacterium sp.]|nr:MAG: noncanonical pyrimidine nucleotidase, YjjG family [Chryseobacterium sp.]
MNFKHIFFDLDNTLWDHRRNAYLTLNDIYLREEIGSLYNLQFEEFHSRYHIINEDLWAKIRDEEIDKEYLRKYRFLNTFRHFGIEDEVLAAKFEKNFLDEIITYNEVVPGARELLTYLSDKGYTLHIITNGFHEVTQRKIDGAQINHFFDVVVCADDVGVRKPNPKIFDHALKLAGAEKAESILIGDDWIADVKGAQNFGMDVIFFDALNEKPQEEGLKVVDGLAEIQKFL